MSFPLRAHYTTPDSATMSDTYPALLQLPRPILDYRIIIAIIKGDVGAVNILKDTLKFSRQMRLQRILLTLGPTTPQTLQPPHGSRILWATFTDGSTLQDGPRLTIVPPNQLTDISLNLEKLSKTRKKGSKETQKKCGKYFLFADVCCGRFTHRCPLHPVIVLTVATPAETRRRSGAMPLDAGTGSLRRSCCGCQYSVMARGRRRARNRMPPN